MDQSKLGPATLSIGAPSAESNSFRDVARKTHITNGLKIAAPVSASLQSNFRI
jgi:hypothetical protein